MNRLFEAAREVCEFLDSRGWSYCLIGGMAVQRWGEPRTTLDVDLTLLTGFGGEKAFAEVLLEAFKGRIPETLEFSLENRILLLESANGTPLDISFGALPFEERMVRNAEKITFAPGIQLPCCIAEDLFIMKAFAGRSRDWADAENIASRNQTMDRKTILVTLKDLFELKGSPELLDRAKLILDGSW